MRGPLEKKPDMSDEPYSSAEDPETDRLLTVIGEWTTRMEETGQSPAEARSHGRAADGHVPVSETGPL